MKNPNQEVNLSGSYDRSYHFGYSQGNANKDMNAQLLSIFAQSVETFLIRMIAVSSILYEQWSVLGFQPHSVYATTTEQC